MIEIEQEAVEGKGKGKPATVKKPKAPIDPDAPKNARSAWLFFLEEIKRKEGHTKVRFSKDETVLSSPKKVSFILRMLTGQERQDPQRTMERDDQGGQEGLRGHGSKGQGEIQDRVCAI